MLMKFPESAPGVRPTARDNIQDNALYLFLNQGYDATSLDEVAKACGITRPAVLYHFGSKEALLTAIVRPAIDGVREAIDTFQVVERPTSRQREIVLRALLEALLAHRGAVGLLGRFSRDHVAAGIGPILQDLNTRTGLALGGREFETDLLLRVKVVATIAALIGLMGPRIPVPLDTTEERDALVSGLLALLDA
jgi:AcrR family transcriptional regulator